MVEICLIVNNPLGYVSGPKCPPEIAARFRDIKAKGALT